MFRCVSTHLFVLHRMHQLGWSLTLSRTKRRALCLVPFHGVLRFGYCNYNILLPLRRHPWLGFVGYHTSTSHITGYGVSTYIRTGAIRERTTIGRRRIFLILLLPTWPSSFFDSPKNPSTSLTNYYKTSLSRRRYPIQRQGNHHDLRLRRMTPQILIHT